MSTWKNTQIEGKPIGVRRSRRLNPGLEEEEFGDTNLPSSSLHHSIHLNASGGAMQRTTYNATSNTVVKRADMDAALRKDEDDAVSTTSRVSEVVDLYDEEISQLENKVNKNLTRIKLLKEMRMEKQAEADEEDGRHNDFTDGEEEAEFIPEPNVISKWKGDRYHPTPHENAYLRMSKVQVARPTGPPPPPPQFSTPLTGTWQQPYVGNQPPEARGAREVRFNQFGGAPAQPPPPPPFGAAGGFSGRRTYRQPPSDVNSLADALARALSLQNENTERFVARQSGSSALPIFSGNPLDWPLFAHHYRQSTVDCRFSPAQNMARLEKALRGEARTTVRSLMIIPNNANAVMDRLEQRFGRPEYVVRALVELARKTPSPKEGKLSSIVDYSNAIANLVATVQTLQVPAYMDNPQLMQELVEKLPDQLRLQWGMRSVAIRGGNLESFSNWIMEIAEAASVVTTPKFNFRDSRREQTFVAAEDDETTAVVTTGGKKKSPDVKCLCCKKESHPLYNCKEFKDKTVEQRWTFVKKNNICFRCLRTGHGLKNCRSQANCRTEGCTRRHNTILHGPIQKKDDDKGKDSEDENEPKELNATMTAVTSATLLRIIAVKLYGPGGEMNVNALLDEGSTVTLISQDVASKLKLVGVSDPLRIHWTNGVSQEDNDSERVDCWIGPCGQKEKYKLKRARTVKELVLPAQRSDLEDIVKKYDHLQKTKMKYLPGRRPLILIGQPHIHLTCARDVVEADEDSPMFTKTKLGWVLHGPSAGITGEDVAFSCFHETDDDIIHNLVKESFALDSIGIIAAASKRSNEDQMAEEKMKAVTKRIGERWETGLLWRKEPVQLPQSKEVALKRLMSIERKLTRNENIKQQYHDKIIHYVKKGYARKLNPAELATPVEKEWFLPHFDRQHPNKPGKIRIVFDAASRANGVSLNDMLLTGPDLLTCLPGVLLKFRERRIAFSGDITEMFHQVKITSEDCPAQRFLWREKEDDDEPSVYQLDVMMFGSVCSPFCAQYVKNHNALEFQQEFPVAVAAITDKHYMDDYLQSVDTEDEAEKLVADVTEVHRRGGFEIGKWISNSKQLLKSINGAEAIESKNLAEWSEIPTQRALGLHWIPELDKFTFRVNLERAGKGIATGEVIPTKRAVLRLLMLVWDPLGFLGHYLIKGKIILQDLWKLKVGWDDELPSSIEKKWGQWITDLPKLSSVKINRCYSEYASSSPDVQVHIYADSSELAGCAIAYLRVLKPNGDVEVSFILSKTRVAPVKPCSIPRMELQAALIASRMGKFILDQLEINVHRVVFWTDSMTVLRWLRSEARKFQQFVSYRVGEIQEITDVNSWRWVPTKENPADEGTREGRAHLEDDARWWCGPSYLKLNENEWPTEKIPDQEPEPDENLEVRRDFVAVVVEEPSFCLPELERFSKYLRLVRSTAYVLKFAYCMRNRKTPPPLLDVKRAEIMLFVRSQWENYQEDMKLLQSGKEIPKSSPLYQLSPMIDKEGCLRMKSRLASAKEEGVRCPVILHPKNGLTKLLIIHYHVMFAHQGEETVRNELRQRFWIPHLRNAIRKIIRDCRTCKLKKAKGTPPMMGALPGFRMEPQRRAFTICGMDYFGPLEVTIGRRREKRYGVLFTCLSVRAVHLELAHSLTTDSCIMAIRRMISRRGQPSQIFSDNGTNLRGAEKEMRLALQELDQDKMTNELSAKAIDWHFIPPQSPHMGGSWERLVKSVKIALFTILKERAPREEVMLTVFAEAEAIVNSRPLTEVPVEMDAQVAITPSHFLIGVSSSSQPPGHFEKEDLDLRKLWRKSQALADMFWRRWVREYLPTLQKRTKWHGNKPSIEVGDMVVIIDESLKRNTWPLGYVTQVFPGKDDIVRVAEVRTAQGVYRRPVVKLGKLDLKTSGSQEYRFLEKSGGSMS